MNGPSTADSDHMLDLLAERFRILGDPARLKILQSLGSGESSVGALAQLTGMPQSTLSRHLQALLRANLVARRKEGLYAYYSVADHTVKWVCDVVCGSLAERLARDLSTVRAGEPLDAPGAVRPPHAET